MKWVTSIVSLSLFAAACGPAPAPEGGYLGWVEDGRGDVWEALIEIEPTGADRCHLHLDYAPAGEGNQDTWLQSDGDGAFISKEGCLYPDAGGELTVDRQILKGCFYSVLGESYCLQVQQVDDQYAIDAPGLD